MRRYRFLIELSERGAILDGLGCADPGRPRSK
jgi:hypothetical protein